MPAGTRAQRGGLGRLVLATIAVAWAAGGCSRYESVNVAPEVTATDMAAIYGRSANYVTPDRNPVIVIHGILGARLQEQSSGRIVWGEAQFSPFRSDDSRELALPMQPGVPLAELTDDIHPVSVLDRVRVSFGPLAPTLTFNAYARILETLGAAGYRPPGFTLLGDANNINHLRSFQFAYDWRRDTVENARRLHQFILARRKQMQEHIELVWGIEDYDVKFDIVAHSMGGLVTRYYTRYGDQDLPADGSLPTLTWEGCKYIENVVIVGTPNLGMVDAFRHLVGGFSAILPNVSPAIVGTMPSVYQLLPRTRHSPLVYADDNMAKLDIYDVRTWERYQWGLADPRNRPMIDRLMPQVPPEQRAAVALDHMDKCLRRAKQFHEALDLDAVPPAGTELHLFAGDAVATNQSARIDRQTGRIVELISAPGDGVVSRSSALGDERVGSPARWTGPRVRTAIRWKSVFFLRADHMGVTQGDDFENNLLYLLLQSPKDAAPTTQPSEQLESSESESGSTASR